MAKRKLDELLAASHAPGTNVKFRLPPEKMIALGLDIVELINVEKKGRVLPPVVKIVEYIAAEYGVVVDTGTVRRWLKKVRKGGQIH
jgi:hypothetical protein